MKNTEPIRPAGPLRLLFWESTSLCNLHCIHCRRNDTTEDLARHDLSTAQVKGLIDDVAGMGRSIFVFSGGEPLMRSDWEELATYARSAGLTTALATNGTLVDPATAARIAGAGIGRVSVSLDGADAATHDAFRAMEGSFDRALRGCRVLRSAGVPLQINCTIARHNLDQLDRLHGLTLELDAVALHLFLLVPVGCGVQIADSHRISPQQYERVLHWVCDREADSRLQLKATCAPHYFRVKAQRMAGRDTPEPVAPASAMHAATRGCLGGISVAFVSHRGEVYPCGYLPVQAGRLDADGRGLARIWADSPLFAELRNYTLLKGKCGRCEYRGPCGGCRARAYALSGDYLTAEPMCPHQPGT